jgi:hypothetical protein
MSLPSVNWLTDCLACGGREEKETPSFHLAVSHSRRLSCRVFPKEKRERRKLSLWNFVGFRKLSLMVPLSVCLSVCLPILSVSSCCFASIYFSCHVIRLCSIAQSPLLVPNETECSGSQWTEICRASTDSGGNKCTLISVKAMSWRQRAMCSLPN